MISPASYSVISRPMTTDPLASRVSPLPVTVASVTVDPFVARDRARAACDELSLLARGVSALADSFCSVCWSCDHAAADCDDIS